MLNKNDKILIAGGKGMVGSALVRALSSEGYFNLLTPARTELDCTRQAAVERYMEEQQPNVVVIAAARVGGIWANMTYPAEFIYENLMISSNLIHAAYKQKVSRLLFLGSSCIYPREASQPIVEDALLSGYLEKTNEAYAIAKIAGIKLCQFYRKQYGLHYISAMPTNLYGPKDNYHTENGHVIPALIRRFHEAKMQNLNEVAIWGTGKARREFLYVDDLAEGCLHLLRHYNDESHVNIGSEDEVTIRELAELIATVVGYKGSITQDLSKPDGTPRKKTDTQKICALGWKAKTPLKEGLQKSYTDFLNRCSRC